MTVHAVSDTLTAENTTPRIMHGLLLILSLIMRNTEMANISH